MLYIGIDLGTSSAKFLLTSENGQILNTVTEKYPLYFPNPGWCEQNPDDWWKACLKGIPRLLNGSSAGDVRGIGIAGQMHGLVALDKNSQVIRPAILWNDGRSGQEVSYLNQQIGRQRISSCTANIAFAGFTAPKLLWMRKHEPLAFEQIQKIMLPKDYLVHKMTGVHCTDYSDAGGTLLLDVKQKCWSEEMLKICGLRKEQLPRLNESSNIAGSLTRDAAASLGLSPNVLVVSGAGDNAAAAVGTGTIGKNKCNISIGTSGTLFLSLDQFYTVPDSSLHSFLHADGSYHLLGCILSAASCNQWFCGQILKTHRLADEQETISEARLGKNSVYFLPYLMGERSPINDENARGAFLGLSLDTSRSDLVQAVLEGVAFSIRDCFEAAKSLPISISDSTICGGGAKSPLWREIFSNVLNLPLFMVQTEQGPGYGAAILAMVGCGQFRDIQEAASALVKVFPAAEPDPKLSRLYEEKYRTFKKIYPALKDLNF